jgi:hypothetical protein
MGWVQATTGWRPGSRKEDEWAQLPLRSAAGRPEAATHCGASDLGPGTCVAAVTSLPALPTRASRACGGRLTRRRSWQQSARKDRLAGARAGHPGAAAGDGAAPGAAADRAVRAARAVPGPDVPGDRAGVAAQAALVARGAVGRLADRARLAGAPRVAAGLATIKVRVWARPIRGKAHRDRRATPAGRARSR